MCVIRLMQSLLKSWKRKFAPSAVVRAAGSVDFSPTDIPLRPGVTLLDGGAQFVVRARHADAVDLCLYDPADPAAETARVRMRLTE